MREQPTQTDTRSTGKLMIALAWICGLGLLTVIFNDVLESQFNPNPAPHSITRGQSTEVRLQQNRAGHYVTTGMINGHKVTFLVDTGATDVSVPFHLANKLGLKPGYRQRVNTANGVIEVAQSSISSLQIGDIQLYNVDANLNPGMQQDKILLGMSVLKQLEFTQRGDQLILRTL